jgi:putative copper export protein
MTLSGLLLAMEHTALAAAMRGEHGGEWLFPIVETLHVICLAIVFGSIVMVDLRLVGVSSRNSAMSRLSSEVLPYTWAAFLCAVATGSLLFISKAHVYFFNLQFQLKFLCMFLAGLNMLVFHCGAFRHVHEWDERQPPPRAARRAGVLSIALWIGVIFFGRWIGFTT